MGSLAALRTVLVLVLVTGLAGCVPGLNGTADRLEALYSRSLARIPGEKREEMSRDSDYLLGIKRLRRLYCNVGIGFHIQVLPDGRITGVHNENRHSLLQISPVERGVVTLLGVRSGLFVAMSRRGKLYGSLHYNNECKFREKLLANNYNSYESVAYPRMYIGLKEKLITSGRYSGYEAKANIRSKELSCPLSKVACVPLTDQGPHITNGWDQVVRFRHLYATRPGLHLLISRDGQIHGSADQTLYSLLEIRPVDPGCVVIRGAATARFLCIEGEGRLYSSHTYSKDDCTFREQILPDGYNIYVSDRHGALLSLGNHRQRLQGRDRGVPALARFLPRVNTLDQTFHPALDVPDQPGQSAAQTEEPMDTMDSFGKLSQIIHSPSFHKR